MDDIAGNHATASLALSHAPVITSSAPSASVGETPNAKDNSTPHRVTGEITFTDADDAAVALITGAAQAFTTTVAPGADDYLGTFTLGTETVDSNGLHHLGWTYSVRDDALDTLAGGDHLVQIYDVAVEDAYGLKGRQTVTIDITGVNDAAVIGGEDTKNLTETSSVLTTAGKLTISDVDGPASFIAQANAEGSGGYGRFQISTNGAWSYQTNASHAEFVGGVTYTDTLTVRAADDTTHSLTVNITGINDAATVDGQDTKNLIETNAVLTTGGTLKISDVDSAQSFVPQQDAPGSKGYGHFQIASDGTWSYKTHSAHDDFADGVTYTDTLTVSAADGTSHLLTVNIIGSNDAAVIGGDDFANLTETGSILAAGGRLTLSDVDNPAQFAAQSDVTGSGSYGHFQFGADGVWAYTTSSAHTEFVGGVTYSDTLMVWADDGTLHSLTVQMVGFNNAAVIGGQDTKNLIETNAVLTTGGKLTISDVDSAQSFVAQQDATGSNSYGHFQVWEHGTWSYKTDSAHDEFVDGVTYTDTLEVSAFDGTQHQLTVNIIGSNDAAVIGGEDTKTLTQSDSALTTGGTLTIQDAEDLRSFVDQSDVLGSAGYGYFQIGADGVWSYQMDSAHIEFANGVTYTDTMTVSAADGTTHSLTVNIIGVDDAPVFDGPDQVFFEETSSDPAVAGSYPGSTVVYAAHATDADTAGSVTYSITGGADADYFSIDASSGEVTLQKAVDLDGPHGQSYYLDIAASNDSNTSSTPGILHLVLTATDVNDNAPSINSLGNTVHVLEGAKVTGYVASGHVTDADATSHQAFSLTGVDAALFKIDENTGALSFINAPDFENPTDQDALNTYDTVVHANDGIHHAAQDVHIIVDNLAGGTFKNTGSAQNVSKGGEMEEWSITTGAFNDTVVGGSGNDTISTGAGNDKITGGAGRDLIDGGAGADWMWGGAGSDTITISGADTISFSGTDFAKDSLKHSFNNDYDTLINWNTSAKLVFDRVSFAGSGMGTGSVPLVVAATHADGSSTSGRFIFDTVEHALYFDGKDPGDLVKIAVLTGVNTLSSANISIT